MFKFKGISSKEMDVYVTEIDNLIRKAPQRYEEIYIDGRDGAFFHPLGYSPIEVPLELTLMKPERIDEVLQWLNGTGWLEYNGRKTKAHIFSEVEPVRASTVRIIQVTIIRNPFWEKVEDDWEEAWGANLIKNGWDSFEPYGNEGQQRLAPLEVFEENYIPNIIENGDFRNDKETWTRVEYVDIISQKNKLVIRPLKNYNIVQTRERHLFVEGDEYFARYRLGYKGDRPRNVRVYLRDGAKSDVKINVDDDLRSGEVFYKFSISEGGEGRVAIRPLYHKTPSEDSLIEIDKIMVVNLTKIYGKGNEPSEEWCYENLKYYANWKDFPKEKLVVPAWDNMAILKTPLGNGLTRIQTWGGNHRIKLAKIYADTPNEGDKRSVSFYVKNLNGRTILRTHNTSQTNTIIKENGEGFYEETHTIPREFGEGWATVWSDKTDDNLDFIASDPIIVEGNKAPNWQATSDPAIYNEGTTVAKPLIKLEKGKDRQCEFEVNGTYFKFHFNDDGHVILDCEEMEATYNGFNRNRHLTIGFEWPKLKPKENFVKRISGDAKILFKRKDRWL